MQLQHRIGQSGLLGERRNFWWTATLPCLEIGFQHNIYQVGKAVLAAYYFYKRLTKSSFFTYLPSLNCGYFCWKAYTVVGMCRLFRLCTML